MSKSRLIILSDLWGKEKSDWVNFYTKVLEKIFEITYYDCCVLGGVDKRNYQEQHLHHQFVNGGITKAVDYLCKNEKTNSTILAFSIGGSIAWKAGLLGLKIQTLYAISSTRLRNEQQKPNAKIELYFGENDLHKPNDDWFNRLHINKQLVMNEGHLIYQKRDFAEPLSYRINEGIG